MNSGEFENPDELKFKQLLLRAQSGDDVAQTELMNRMQNYIQVATERQNIGYLQHKCGASDIFQMAMLEVFKSLDRFKGSTEGEFKAWVRAIVEHQVKQTQRGLTRQKRDVFREVRSENVDPKATGFIDHQLTPQSDAIQRENLDRVAVAISRLSNDYRKVVQLRSLERKPFREIALEMQRSEDAVTKLWFRALTKLQEMLNHDDGSVA